MANIFDNFRQKMKEIFANKEDNDYDEDEYYGDGADFENPDISLKDYVKEPENVWIFDDGPEIEILTHTFGEQKVFFLLENGAFENGVYGISFYPNVMDKCRDYPDYVIPYSSNDNGYNAAKNFVKNTIEFFNKEQNVSMEEIKIYMGSNYNSQGRQEATQAKTPEQSPLSDRQLETAQKTGYVQGVCESVLAFNNDENRKIMSEATMTFLSKKLLSEMNVTKDMAQKFANPETYKALEQCIFAPKQEQYLEQTQSRGRGL